MSVLPGKWTCYKMHSVMQLHLDKGDATPAGVHGNTLIVQTDCKGLMEIKQYKFYSMNLF